MRHLALLLAALPGLAACSPAEGGAKIPAPLERLRLNEEHPTMTPVLFEHALHADPARLGPDGTCAHCHHTLAEHPDEVPQRCGACHVSSYLVVSDEPPVAVEESEPHDHPPPDL